MTSIQDILKLCEAEQGKVFVLDAKGDVRVVILSVAEYRKLKPTQSSARQTAVDPEVVNKQITQAQLSDNPSILPGASSNSLDLVGAKDSPVPIGAILRDWHKGARAPQVSMDEVIDTGWDEAQDNFLLE